ncbi:Enhancer of rudimentary protein [Theobroma cacao]|uniref:Enhancer of rudimentary protein n=1 Tax=Theobroma cacao TaxID=3641 RepID=A0A061GHI7_THECC|nr:Enhancer of rudimentary protein [Theobroma cacao]
MANRHTIVLMQTSQNRATRTFMDYDSISQAMDEEDDQTKISALNRSVLWLLLVFTSCWEVFSFMELMRHRLANGICGLYERKLKELNPAIRNITYDIGDLYNFIDGLADMSALVYDHAIQAFLPYDRQWIKQKVFQHLKKLAH